MMAMQDQGMMDQAASDGMAVAPEQGDDDQGRVREAHDADDDEALKANPSSEDAKLDVALDETFPTSDAPSNTQPGKGKDPAPSTGFDEAAERSRSA